MLQAERPDDYVLATGETHSVRKFAETVFGRLGMPLSWRGEGVQEEGIDQKSGKVVIKIDPRYFRPAEVDLLLGDASKAKRELGWEVTTSFTTLVEMMTDSDLALAQRELRADG
jgi:GDPmannose 4,6-dehydratase